MAKEKRKYLRFECLVPVGNIKVEGKVDKISQASVQDISREGLRLVLDLVFCFDPGSDIDFKVKIPEQKTPSKVKGEVMWCKPKGRKLQVGLKIKNMSKATKNELLDVAYSRWREQLEKTKKTEKKKKP